MLQIILAILAFGVLVIVHEFGHFITAKRGGVQVNEFWIGMGPTLLKHEYKGTLYCLKLLPFGGACVMEGEDGESESEHAFGRARLRRRILIVAAGALMNFLIGFVILLFAVQAPSENGFITTTVASISEGSSVLEGGLQEGDTIISIDGFRLLVRSDLNVAMGMSSSTTHSVKVRRGGETVELPCDLVISAVGEQVEEQVFTDNGITLSAKGRPAFCTNVPGVYAAGDALRGPATVVEGIADAARFAEAVIGAPHTYDIPAEAHPTEAEAIARKGILRAPGKACCEGERCLSCDTVCQNCVDVCPNRANVAVRLPDGRTEIVHVDKMCNECGNCTAFCPYSSEPCKDKLTLFQTTEDMDDSKNFGFCFLPDGKVRARLTTETVGDPDELPADAALLVRTIRDSYSYLYR